MNRTAKYVLFLCLIGLSVPLSADPTLWDFVRRFWNETMMLRAASQGNLDNVKYYMSQGCNINCCHLPIEDGYSSLANATINDRPEVIKYLLQQKAHFDTCTEGDTLKLAVRNKRINTPFTVLLWAKYEIDKEEALEEIERYKDSSYKETLKWMVADFEGFVKNCKQGLSEIGLWDQIEEYKKQTKPIDREYIRVNGMEGFIELTNYNFDL